jgi:hypothetical protein
VIGVRSLAIVVLLAITAGGTAWSGALDLDTLGQLSVASCLAIGAMASIAVGLISAGGSLARPGHAALDLRRRQLLVEQRGVARAVGEVPPVVRELPGWMLQVLLLAAFLIIGAIAMGRHGPNHGMVRLMELNADRPPSGRCRDPEAVQADEPEPEPLPPVEVAGCALVRRAYQLGYAKSLGSCAPGKATAAPVVPKLAKPVEPCTRRQLDEPFLHFAWRQWTAAARHVVSIRPLADTVKKATELEIKVAAFAALTANSGHALGATPHASHHLWVSSPDPHPASWWRRHLIGVDCEVMTVELPLWPSWQPGQTSALIEHSLGQLLFASRFGTTTTCANYRMHWDAPVDACDQLVAAPETFLRRHGAWNDVVGVLDRRRRQLQLRALAETLRRPGPPEPPPASAIVSLQCYSIDATVRAAEVRGRWVALAGERIGVRQMRVPRVVLDADGPVDVLAQLAQLLAGAPSADNAVAREQTEHAEPDDATSIAPGVPAAALSSPAANEPPRLAAPMTTPMTTQQAQQLLADPEFALAGLEALESADPFRGVRWPLQRPDLPEIYPFYRYLFDFIDGFRRRYYAQRGRL